MNGLRLQTRYHILRPSIILSPEAQPSDEAKDLSSTFCPHDPSRRQRDRTFLGANLQLAALYKESTRTAMK